MSLNIETLLTGVLQAICPRTFPDVAPTGTAAPYIVWHQYGGQAPGYTEGLVATHRNSYVQINVWSTTRQQCNEISMQIEAALLSHPVLQAEALNALSAVYDEDTDLRASMQDFSLWAER